jgi:hypothetical protein
MDFKKEQNCHELIKTISAALFIGYVGGKEHPQIT